MPIWLKEKLYMKTVLRNEFKAIMESQDPGSTEDKKAIKLPKYYFRIIWCGRNFYRLPMTTILYVEGR